jgi:peptide/nickel transport system substrate-binding protein
MSRNPNPQPSRRSFLAGGLSVGAALLLPGCTAAVHQSAAGGKSSGPATNGGTLHVVQTADIAPTTLLSQNNPNFSLCRTVFNTLTEYDHTTLKPKPSLATAWQVRDGGRTYVLTLRDDVKFHSGRPFGPDDVVAVIGLLHQDATASQTKAVAAICDAKKTGAHEVTLTFSKAVNNVFDLFEMMIMVDHESYPDLLKGSKFIGTGPFTMKNYQPGTGFTLKRNPNYWIPGRPYLDGVGMQVITQSSSAVAALKSGQAQLALDLAPLDAADLQSTQGFDLVAANSYDAVYYLGQNVTVKPLDDPAVRQAIAFAIDRNRILEQVLGKIGYTSSLPWSKSSPAYDANKRDTYHYDIAKAKSLLSRAGATGASVDIYYNAGFAPNGQIAEIVQFGLNQAGLKVNPKPTQAADFFTLLSGTGIPGLFVNVHGFGQLEPATLVNGAVPFNAAMNAEQFSNKAYSALADEAWTATDPAAAKKVYEQISDLLLHQQFVTDLVVSAHTYAISSKLQGLQYTMFDYLNLDNASLAT